MIATKNHQPEGIIMNIRSAVAGAAVVGCLLASGATAAQAWVAIGTTTAYPVEGGTWQFGYGGLSLFSDYTVNRCHGTTTQKYNDGKLTGTSISPNTASGQKAASGIRTTNTASLEGKYYYRVC